MKWKIHFKPKLRANCFDKECIAKKRESNKTLRLLRKYQIAPEKYTKGKSEYTTQLTVSGKIKAP